MAPAAEQQQAQQPEQAQALLAALTLLLLAKLSADALSRSVAALLIPLGFPAVAVGQATTLVLQLPVADVDDSPETASHAMARTAAARRAMYLLEAVRRLATGGSLAQERRYFDAHRKAEKARREAAKQVDAAAVRWGPVLGWRATMDSVTTPECRAAHGHNFRAAVPPAIGYPGTLHAGNCRCKPGAPFPGAKLLP